MGQSDRFQRFETEIMNVSCLDVFADHMPFVISKFYAVRGVKDRFFTIVHGLGKNNVEHIIVLHCLDYVVKAAFVFRQGVEDNSVSHSLKVVVDIRITQAL